MTKEDTAWPEQLILGELLSCKCNGLERGGRARVCLTGD